MQYIINAKILSLPPYVSTSWDNVCSLHVEFLESIQFLVITLHNGTLLKVPNLDSDTLTKIFQTHTQYLELLSRKESVQEAPSQNNPFNFENVMGLGLPMKFGGTLEGVASAMQHNPSQANSPSLPKEVLEKISAISKIVGTDQDLQGAMKAVPHCNCNFCQIARAMTGEFSTFDSHEEDDVSDDDLKFKTWDISQSGEKCYVVTNPLDKKEQYSVYLGEPLGCTCGHSNCEHIKAVLNT